MSDPRPIGVFDSGMGGLTVMRALMARLPGESFVYLGDTARLPYGTKSADTVRRYAIQAAKALETRGVKLVVIACNTASVSLPQVAEALAPLPAIGVIAPGAHAALAASPAGPIAVLATEGTVKGGAYRTANRAEGSGVPIVQQAFPVFLPRDHSKMPHTLVFVRPASRATRFWRSSFSTGLNLKKSGRRRTGAKLVITTTNAMKLRAAYIHQ